MQRKSSLKRKTGENFIEAAASVITSDAWPFLQRYLDFFVCSTVFFKICSFSAKVICTFFAHKKQWRNSQNHILNQILVSREPLQIGHFYLFLFLYGGSLKITLSVPSSSNENVWFLDQVCCIKMCYLLKSWWWISGFL